MENEKPKPAPGTTSMDVFNIVDKSETGIKVELSLPNGDETGEFLTVRGADSQTFQKAKARHNRQVMNLVKASRSKDEKKQLDPADLEMREKALLRELAAVLVVGWSFKDEEGNPVPCTLEAVVDFFKKAPQVQEQVDAVAGQRRHFFNKPSTK